MPDFSGRLRASGRVAILVSRYNEVITRKLLEGALACCGEAGLSRTQVDVIWVPGAFELPTAAAAAAQTGRYGCLVALGAVIRGETPHFEFVAGAAVDAVQRLAVEVNVPIALGLLTTETLEQATRRADPDGMDKGGEAARAALAQAMLYDRLRATRGAVRGFRVS